MPAHYYQPFHSVMPSLTVDISISYDEYIKQYQFPGVVVSTYARSGQSVQFPANILQPFIDHRGISGTFQIEFDDNGKFSAINRVN